MSIKASGVGHRLEENALIFFKIRKRRCRIHDHGMMTTADAEGVHFIGRFTDRLISMELKKSPV